MKQKIIETITKYNLIKSGDSIVLGVSGGPDSICMLYILNEIKEKYKLKLYIAHINHLIRENAKKDEEYVLKTGEKLHIPVYIKHAEVEQIAKQQKISTEEAGRNVRYKFFKEILEKTNSNKIATAHNSNDKSETVIMNILRGSGAFGLKGIEPIRNNIYIRPLIESSREEIEKYCDENNLNPRIDETNKENIYSRNKIRNVVIPYIKKEFNQNIINTINRLSEVITEENNYLEKITQNTYNEICETFDFNVGEGEKRSANKEHTSQIVLNLKKFNNLELVIKRRVILYTINELLSTTKGIERINIEDIIKLCDNNIGNKYLMPIKDIKVLVKSKKIFFVKQ